mmetsp:Transcript_33156/g.75545  ORF Transcript_33156/g.75545 Transcript_33156/m.75545 type:complete len:264 (+) Transcript_33156:495-1286(+)
MTKRPQREIAMKVEKDSKARKESVQQEQKHWSGLSSASKLHFGSQRGKPQQHLLKEHDMVLGFARSDQSACSDLNTCVKPQKPEIDLKSVPKRLRRHVVSLSQLVKPLQKRRGLHGGRGERLVHEESEEYRAVTDYFVKTLSPHSSVVKVDCLERLRKPKDFLTDGCETVMFHGCRTAANQTAIMRDGFQVSCCRSGAMRYGTWLAYNASYSNSGFVYQDVHGLRHIFVCIASDYYTVLDNDTMRVVGQDCCYPQWLLRYRIS